MSKSQNIGDVIIKKFFRKKVDYNKNLFDAGILDSIRLIDLIIFIEKTFKVKIHEKELKINNFNNLEKIIKTIQKKK